MEPGLAVLDNKLAVPGTSSAQPAAISPPLVLSALGSRWTSGQLGNWLQLQPELVHLL